MLAPSYPVTVRDFAGRWARASEPQACGHSLAPGDTFPGTRGLAPGTGPAWYCAACQTGVGGETAGVVTHSRPPAPAQALEPPGAPTPRAPARGGQAPRPRRRAGPPRRA